MSATKLEKACEIPLSTLYRKLELLHDATLVRELHDIDPERGRITRYQRNFDTVTISIDPNDCYEVEINRPDRTPETRLANMWKEMRDEI